MAAVRTEDENFRAAEVAAETHMVRVYALGGGGGGGPHMIKEGETTLTDLLRCTEMEADMQLPACLRPNK